MFMEDITSISNWIIVSFVTYSQFVIVDTSIFKMHEGGVDVYLHKGSG